VIRTFLVQTFVITSGSMEDTLLIGDFLVVNRLALGARIPGTVVRVPGYAEPERGDVLVFESGQEQEPRIVKRLIGLPGDTLEMRAKQLFINGMVQNEPYVKNIDSAGDPYDPEMIWQRSHLLPGTDATTYSPTRDNWGPIVVPDGSYFMLGDNRDGSRDSRFWGPVERWRLMGEPVFFYYSYDRDSPTPFAFFREGRWDRIGRMVH
jgi:signal peptidase I